MHRRVLVLFSGGQDSATCVAWALSRFAQVETVGFDYGQRHSVELACRPGFLQAIREEFPDWCNRLGPDHVLEVPVLGRISDTALTSDRAIEYDRSGLPTTFVPGRNLLFFVLAGALAYRRGLSALVGGMCETDYSGYPDCRDNTLKAQQVALSLGLAAPMAIETPLMWLDKAATWALAQELGGPALLELVRTKTHTCYLGERGTLHPWGFGCGACPACELRMRGFDAFRLGKQASAAKPPVPRG